MLLTYLMLIAALCLSAVAAFYSIVGLTAIFAAAVVPIIIMGSILEASKLVVTVWLHEYWNRCKLSMKIYLVPAVGMLMLITSMGIFGFLSKAHSDQSLVSGDVLSKISIYDEKIKIAKENIDANRKALKQMDEAVDQVMGRSQDEKGADKAVALRRGQAKERTRLLSEITAEQKVIAQLSEERAPIAAEVRKVEAEVGPIKYIAALVYGDNPDANLLERAVRWVIIILVVVFDPLAIFMLLAATESFKWDKEEKNQETSNGTTNDDSKHTTENLDGHNDRHNDVVQPDDNVLVVPEEPKVSVDPHPVGWAFPKVSGDLSSAERFGIKPATTPISDEALSAYNDERLVSKFDKMDLERPGDYITPPEYTPEETPREEEHEEEDSSAMRQAKHLWKQDNPKDTLKEQRRLFDAGIINQYPWEAYLTDPRIVHDAGFGRVLPNKAERGDMFVLVDHLPTKLYKYNGEAWIEVDKNLSDNYAYNQAYIDHLINRISSGEYDPELLTDSERSQIESRLRQNTQ